MCVALLMDEGLSACVYVREGRAAMSGGVVFQESGASWRLFSVASDSIPEHDLRRLLGEARKGSRRLFCF